jgi:hypothetical protein
MRKKLLALLALAVGGLLGSANADIITVNTVDNTDFSPGKTNLWLALTIANTNGVANTINFAITGPGSGPYWIETPPYALFPGVGRQGGGYPLFTNCNLTINGYSQTGASPNTHSITQANNAVIQIILSSTNGGATPMAYMNFTGVTTNKNGTAVNTPGFDSTEAAQLGFFRATNIVIQGLCFVTTTFNGTVGIHSIAFAIDDWGPAFNVPINDFPACVCLDARRLNNRISGCWFGVLPNGTTIFPGDPTATTYNYDTIRIPRHRRGNNTWGQPIPAGIVIGVEPSLTEDLPKARSQFNVFIKDGSSLIGAQMTDAHIAGNFFNIYPDGMNQFQNPNEFGANTGVYIENARDGLCWYGTDGDGHNDAEEKNIFAGLWHNNIAIDHGSIWTNLVIAGNYFGMAVDAVTRLTNYGTFLRVSDKPTSAPRIQVGSDFDGVSDELEANLIANNWPDLTVPQYSGSGQPSELIRPAKAAPDAPASNPWTQVASPGGGISFRGNRLINNYTAPTSWNYTSDNSPTSYAWNYWQFCMATNNIYDVMDQANFLPVLSASSSTRRLRGTFDLGQNYHATNVIVDLYIPNLEGMTNGAPANWPGLTWPLPAEGWVQGEVCIAHDLVADTLGDLDLATGAFNFNISSLRLTAGTKVTVTATYPSTWTGDASNPPDTLAPHNRTAHTTRFSIPVALAAASAITITSLTNNHDGTVTLSWTGGDAPYILESCSSLTPGSWHPVLTNATTTATVNIAGGASFFRLQ